jgi:hypothetical protein
MRGEVSIFRGGAGGILYLSSGSLKGALWIGDSVCPETIEGTSRKLRPMKELRIKSVENLIG